MATMSRIAYVELVICAVIVVCLGCNGLDPQPGVADDVPRSMLQEVMIGSEQVEALLEQVSRLRAVSQEALDAAAVIGTTDSALAGAQQVWVTAEQSWREGHLAYEAGQYRISREKLRLAGEGFKRAEERAVRAGLSHIEDELAQEYAHSIASDEPRSGVGGGSVQVVEGVVNLRDGAGLNFQVIGNARLGQVLQLLAEVGEWYQVRTEQGTVGWVSKALAIRRY